MNNIREFLTFMSLFEQNQMHLQQKYNHYNKLLFGGELPNIPIEFKDLKTVGGKVTYKIQNVTRANPRLVRLGIADKFQGGEFVPGS